MTNLFWNLRGDYATRKEKLASWSKEDLAACILDSQYNEFLRARADYEDGYEDPHGHGKRLPYIGWFWRHLEFSDGALPIGNCGDFIGFIRNNKWNYPERMTTPSEFAEIMSIIDNAMFENEKGGDLKENVRNTNNELSRLWDYMQTSVIK